MKLIDRVKQVRWVTQLYEVSVAVLVVRLCVVWTDQCWDSAMALETRASVTPLVNRVYCSNSTGSWL